MNWLRKNSSSDVGSDALKRSARNGGSASVKDRRLFGRGKTITARSTTDGRSFLVKSERGDLRNLAQKRGRIIRLLIVSLSVAIITTVIITLTIHSPKVHLRGDDIIAAGDTDMSGYDQIIKDYFRNYPFDRLKPALKIASLNSYLHSKAPEIKSVASIENNFIKSTTIVVDVRRPIAMWESSGRKYYVDEDGVPFLKNYFPDPEISVVDKSGIPTSAVSQVANNNFISFIGQVVALSSERGVKISQIVIPPLTTRQIEVYFESKAFPVRMSTSDSSPQQVDDAIKMINHLDSRGITPSYIDVRVARRSYYK